MIMESFVGSLAAPSDGGTKRGTNKPITPPNKLVFDFLYENMFPNVKKWEHPSSSFCCIVPHLRSPFDSKIWNEPS